MLSNKRLATIALLTAAIGAPLVLGGCTLWAEPMRSARAAPPITSQAELFDYRMQTVPNEAAGSAPAYGWRYFSDPSEPRAVVISPRGDYYFSRGDGLSWIAAAQY